MENENIQLIKNYIKRGWSPFPVQLTTRIEDGNIKKDVIFPIEDGKQGWKKFQSERLTEDKVDWAWITLEHVGIATGKISGITCIDVDTKDNVLPKDFPETYTVETKKGFHYYFKYNKDIKQTQNGVKNIDIRNDGGFLFAPPTKYKLPDGSFAEYKIIKDIPMAEFPFDWYKKTFNQEANNWKDKIISPISQGTRNMDFASIIGGMLYRFPMNEWESIVWVMVQDKNKLQEKPLSQSELRATYESIARTETQRRHQGGEIKDIVVNSENEEIRIDISLELATICFKVKDIVGVLMEATIITWIQKPNGIGYEIPFHLKIKSDTSKELWGRILKDAFNKKEDKEIYPWTILIAKVVNEIDKNIKNSKQDFLPSELEAKKCTWLLEPFIQEDQINTIFGMGSSGKTLLSLYFAKQIVYEKGVNVMFIDYEDVGSGWKDKLSKISSISDIPINLDNFVYFDSRQIPVAEQVEKIRDIVKKRNIKLVILDSASLATGDSTSDEKSAVRLVSALKLLNTTILIIAHQRKNDGDKTPIGSIQYENQSRNVWNIKGNPDDKDVRVIHTACTHTKANNTYLRREPYGFKIVYSDEAINITRESAQAYFDDKYTIQQKIERLLKNEGSFDVKGIADSLGLKVGIVSKTLSVGKERGIWSNNDGLWSLNTLL